MNKLINMIIRVEATSAGFQGGHLSWLNWNLECWCLWREENLREKPSEQGNNQQQSQPTYSTWQELNTGHIGRR